MRKILVLFFIFLIATLSLSMMETVNATNITISPTTPGGLKIAIATAQNGDTIYLEKGNYNGVNNTNITINKDIAIEAVAPKVVLDGQGTNHFFKINLKTVKLKNLKFSYGYGGGKNGGAISSKGNLTVINCTFTNNKTNNKINSRGGAIYSTGNLNLTKSIFTNHRANFGGAIYSTGNLSVADCIFTNNKASHGGAIHASLITVKKSIFTNNAGTGGAIKSWDNTNVISCTFKNNIVKNHNGGAIYSGAKLTVDKSTFTNNKAANEGGAIAASKQTKIIKSIFRDNQAYLRGGAIVSDFFSELTVESCTFTNNQAYLKGRKAISFHNGKPTAYVTAKGGAIFYAGKSTKISNSKFNKNIAGEVYNAIDRDKSLTRKKASLKNVKISPKESTKVKK